MAAHHNLTFGPGSIVSHDENAHIKRARERWGAGDFDGCIAEIDQLALNRHTSESIFLYARALLRVHRIEAAEHWLRMMEIHHTTQDAIATHAMLLGNVSARLSKFDDANDLFDRARSATPHPTIVAETAYFHALAFWQKRDFPRARHTLRPVLGVDQDIVSARIAQLMGFIARAEGNYREAHRHFESALDILSGCQASDLHLEATLLHQLTIGSAEIEVRNLADLDHRVHALAWTTNLAMERVQSLRHIGLAYVRQGDYRSGIARFVECSLVMPRSAWAIIGFAEAANQCFMLNEAIGGAGYLSAARQIADGIDWDVIQGEPRLALLLLATVLGRIGERESAQSYLQLYYGEDGRGTRLPALSALNLDLRLQCFEGHAEGIIRGAFGDPEAAAILAEVGDEWRRLSYHFRVKEVRQDIESLKRTINADSASIVVVPPPKLTGQQDRIIRLLVQGRSIAQVAQALNIETKSVRGHLSKIYAVFNVDGQRKLLVTILNDPHFRKTFAAA
jgi:tetratricopeptide (TPR) repeat protein